MQKSFQKFPNSSIYFIGLNYVTWSHLTTRRLRKWVLTFPAFMVEGDKRDRGWQCLLEQPTSNVNHNMDHSAFRGSEMSKACDLHFGKDLLWMVGFSLCYFKIFLCVFSPVFNLLHDFQQLCSSVVILLWKKRSSWALS